MKFLAEDGKQFDIFEECKTHEEKLSRLREIEEEVRTFVAVRDLANAAAEKRELTVIMNWIQHDISIRPERYQRPEEVDIEKVIAIENALYEEEMRQRALGKNDI